MDLGHNVTNQFDSTPKLKHRHSRNSFSDDGRSPIKSKDFRPAEPPCSVERYFRLVSEGKEAVIDDQMKRQLKKLLPSLPECNYETFISLAQLQEGVPQGALTKANNLCYFVKVVLRGTVMIRAKQKLRSETAWLPRGFIVGQVQNLYRRMLFEDVIVGWDYVGLSIRGEQFRKLFTGKVYGLEFDLARLRNYQFLRDMDDAAVHYLYLFSNVQTYRIHQTIVRRGSTIDKLHFIERGQVDLVSYLRVSKELNRSNQGSQTRRLQDSQLLIKLRVVRIGEGRFFMEEGLDQNHQLAQKQAVASSQVVIIRQFDRYLLLYLLGKSGSIQSRVPIERLRNELEQKKLVIAANAIRKEQMEDQQILEEKLMVQHIAKNLDAASNKRQQFKAFKSIRKAFSDINDAPENVVGILRKYARIRNKQKPAIDLPEATNLYKNYNKTGDKIRRMMARMEKQNCNIRSCWVIENVRPQPQTLQFRLKNLLRDRSLAHKGRQNKKERRARRAADQHSRNDMQTLNKLKKIAAEQKVIMRRKQLQKCSISEIKERRLRQILEEETSIHSSTRRAMVQMSRQ